MPNDGIAHELLEVVKIYNPILQEEEEDYEPPLGQPGHKVTLSMRAEFAASYAAGENLNELADTILNASKPVEFVDTGKPLSFETINSHRTDNEGVTRWTMRVSRQLEKHLDTGKIIPLVQGREIAIATEKLEDNLDLPYTPKIRLTPNWWPWLPLIPFNITVETQ